ncbi:HEPN domain-containing protein [Candidatus Pacearchaeota archaeon]|nr:HEPN domain-containing protein [Candidatus Pacearchaeota archaeon]
MIVFPYIHNLKRLAVLAGLPVSVERSDELLKISTYNLESRYPDINRTFRKKCTPDFTKKELNNIREVFEWLKLML